MRDVLFVPFNHNEVVVVASDNSGAIGMKQEDAIKVTYETVAYYSFRVAVMECMAVGGNPFAVTLHNFCGEDAWLELKSGVQKGLSELGLENVQLTGSTESNFTLSQSAIGLTVLGKKKRCNQLDKLEFTEKIRMAVIGSPLVGNEVIECEDEVAPLSLFKQITAIPGVTTLPVGSKGILYELNHLFSNRTYHLSQIETGLDNTKSSGPSTCFIVAYPIEKQTLVMNIAGVYFHEIRERSDFDA